MRDYKPTLGNRWYHGTTDDETLTVGGLDAGRLGRSDVIDDRGSFWTPDRARAETYADMQHGNRPGTRPVIIEADDADLGPFLGPFPRGSGSDMMVPVGRFPDVPNNIFRRSPP